MSYANCTVAGYVASQPKIFTTQNGMQIMSFSIPIKNRNKDTGWIQCKIFGKQVEFLQPRLNKGTFVSATGAMTPFKYTTKDGAEREGFELSITPFCIDFPFEKSQQGQPQGQSQQPQQGQTSQQQYSQQQQDSLPPPNLDEIPF